MVTIDDVAKRAGVSKGTVSSVFSKKRPVSTEVSERVLKIAKELNYYPSQIARSLATRKTMTIGLKMPTYKDYELSYFETQIINGVVKKCSENGYRVLLDRLIESKTSINDVRDPVDGVILLNPRVSDPRLPQYKKLNIPYILIGRPDKGDLDTYYVDNNNQEIVREVGEYLIENGHKKILFLNADRKMTVTEDRKEGLKQAYKNYGLKFREENILYNDESLNNTASEYGYISMLENYEKGKFTAVITDTDWVALGVFRAARELGLDIPNDLSVVALSNNDRLALETTPQLTSVELFPEKLGEEAVETLLNILSKKLAPKRKIIKANKVIRQS